MGKDEFSAFNSQYVIDGVTMDVTPACLLSECMKNSQETVTKPLGLISDETLDPPAVAKDCELTAGECLEKLSLCKDAFSQVNLFHSGTSTRVLLAKALLDTLWKEGHFALGDLRIKALWRWNEERLGNRSAFYRSVEAASRYIFDLGVDLEDYDYQASSDACCVEFSVSGVREEVPGFEKPDEGEDFFVETPFESTHPWLGEGVLCSGKAAAEKSSWLIYIPFDTCRYRLGGSLLSHACGEIGGTSSEISDPDYFMDCFEVVRELCEDGIVKAGCSVSRGGLMKAVSDFCKCGMRMDISGLVAATGETSQNRILFSEVPGVVIQIADADYDYVDGQLLLQDVAYYPLGHPLDSGSDQAVTLAAEARPAISGILQSLIDSRAEGED